MNKPENKYSVSKHRLDKREHQAIAKMKLKKRLFDACRNFVGHQPIYGMDNRLDSWSAVEIILDDLQKEVQHIIRKL